jgi:hypothetical protein
MRDRLWKVIGVAANTRDTMSVVPLSSPAMRGKVFAAAAGIMLTGLTSATRLANPPLSARSLPAIRTIGERR